VLIFDEATSKASKCHLCYGAPECAAKLNATQRLMWRIIARMVKVVGDKYGEEGLQTLYEGVRDWDFWKVPVKKAGLVPGEASLEDTLYKVLEAGDEVLFTMEQRPLIEKVGKQLREMMPWMKKA
jgi:hypothetical protein